MNKNFLLPIGIVAVLALSLLFGKNIASLVFGLCFLGYFAYLYKYKPAQINTEFKELSAYKGRQLKLLLIWLPLMLCSILLYQQFWRGQSEIINVLFIVSLILAFVIEKLFFGDKKGS